jgi:predicted regulator of Ras-like GTPase activity (Roadblock/LC7/MglB family)
MSRADPARVRAWSEEVARDPESLSFLPLAAAYRAEGRPEAALRLCLRGLERHPDHVEAHHLLGLLYLERGEELKAFDEWDIALRLDGDHHASRREIARMCLRRGDAAAARRHLERLRAAGQDDGELEAMLREAGGEELVAPEPPPAPAATPAPAAPPGAASGGAPAQAPPESDSDAPLNVARNAFAEAALAPGVAGAVLMDTRGLALLEAFAEEGIEGRGAEMAAHLSGASDEARRVARHLGLGGWRSIVIETDQSVIHVSPTGDGMLAVAVKREVPMGWAVRHAARVRSAAESLAGGEVA